VNFLPKVLIAIYECGYLKCTKSFRSTDNLAVNLSLYLISCSTHILNALLGTNWHYSSIALTV